MRLLRVLLLALFGLFAVIAGLFTAAAVAIGAAMVMFVRRLRRQQSRAALPGPPPRRARPGAGEIIDVTATEVPVESNSR
jgi:hypothetical protein